MKLRAPRKDLAWFDDSGHAPCFEEPDKFIEYMAGTVLASTAAR
jgi:pimeloyl-ACP methyl ester carboxylesterase